MQRGAHATPSALPGIWDELLDRTIAPGYSRIGWTLRSRQWSDLPPGRLDGEVAVVTGASSGIGEATAEGLARAGAAVVMVVRDAERGEQARARVLGRLANAGELRLERCDLSRLADVRALAERLRAEVPRIRVLVNNAGVMPPEREHTDEGLELTFATNVAGPFLLTRLLMEPLRAAAPARVITVSSGGMYTRRLDAGDVQYARREFNPSAFYAHTKRQEVILTEMAAERCGAGGVRFHCMHPGWVDTAGLRTAYPRSRALRSLLRTPAEGADTIVWLAVAADPLTHPGGFWQDRRLRPTHYLGRTRETPAEREQLWRELQRLTADR